MNDPRVHGNILVHKHSKRAYSVVHPKVLGPDRIIRIGVIDTTTGAIMYIPEDDVINFDIYTKSEWNRRKQAKVNPFIPTPNRIVRWVPETDDHKNVSSTNAVPSQSLFDVLEVDDLISHRATTNGKHNNVYLVTYIDRVTRYVTVSSKDNNEDIYLSIPANTIIMEYTRVGKREAAKPHILNIVRILETRIYEHLYSNTWLDRYYHRYCIKRGRDIPREERIEDEEHIFVAPGEIYRYLKENIPLDDLKALKNELNADHELEDISKTTMEDN